MELKTSELLREIETLKDHNRDLEHALDEILNTPQIAGVLTTEQRERFMRLVGGVGYE